MWPSSSRNNNSSTSPSKSKSSSSTSSSPAPFSPSSSSATKTTMEEVWRDISLSSLNDHSNSTLTNTNSNHNNNNQHSNYPSLILQDFLARPFFNNDPPARARGPSAEPTFPSLKPPLATMLSLNSGSGSDVQGIEPSAPDPGRPNQQLNGHMNFGTRSFGCSHNTVLDAMDSPTVFPPYCKKRLSENDDYSDDRRHKRMIKNRESAARSRARKQAYTNELELEVAHLVEENAKLKRQQEKLLAASAQLPKKNTLHRTSTAPF
ncbi:protein FD [Mangifera indica]|uniref:protein FD n=1 Tax=Mangifera indica TaxID=29780 RepID=UPI001CF9A247|nr:protein FD [Mangifera indica]